ncbi:NAD-dependent glyceraldehyde-3-phosphate dehydrogenase [Thermosulfurimonas dismutans]|uniref:NAD-dependent glyceraldehyde-3-phosphate dehydrogenase n=1 Tax=Thermosulfurimonas dismutans TaxID=999894 RepID=A0A179D131_9BACT|nr:NAD-dependent glyceraldehyde-3-phosphate dehydrogenase [Thermosulfurimonas dismutans]
MVIPEMKRVGFMAESVRIPTTTGSLIVLVVNIQDESLENRITRETINEIYRQAAEGPYKPYLVFTLEQNVSTDIIGYPRAAAIIEGAETHTRTALARVDLSKACKGITPEEVKVTASPWPRSSLPGRILRIVPVISTPAIPSTSFSAGGFFLSSTKMTP